ncbi:MAG TPA: hypothetical protein VIJ82_27400 [Streptosporangiaceae bacterium]
MQNVATGVRRSWSAGQVSGGQVSQVSRLVVIGTASGKISRVLLSGPQAAQAAPAALDGGALLFTLGARRVRAHHAGAPYVSGHLAGLSLATGQITRLPYPVYTGVEAPAWPMRAAW